MANQSEKISGFTLVRNGVKFDYPFIESMKSLLPLVDELVVNVGYGDDDTLEQVQKFARDAGQGKVLVFESEWPLNDPEKRKSGLILSEQTNLALDRCQYDWCIYLQADEVLHEEDYPKIQEIKKEVLRDPEAEAVVFEYRHFYGSYQVVQKTRSAYRREIRMVKKSSGARSVGDAQSFLGPEDTKLDALLTDARIFHYGWVRPPEAMFEKNIFMDQLYHGEQKAGESLPHSGTNYQYKRFWGLWKFNRAYPGETHPRIMRERILKRDWNWDLSRSRFVMTLGDFKKILLDFFEVLTGHRLFEFKNYRRLKE